MSIGLPHVIVLTVTIDEIVTRVNRHGSKSAFPLVPSLASMMILG